MENTTNGPLLNTSATPDFEQHKKDIQAQLNSLLAHQAEESAPVVPVAVSHQIVPDVTTPAFSGMSTSQPHVEVPKPVMPTFVPPTPHVSKVEFTPNTFDLKRTFAPLPPQKSSHTILWIIIFLTVLFLALMGGVGYWYLKIYAPQNLVDDTASTTVPTNTAKTQNTPKVFTTPVRSTNSAPFQATAKPQVKTPEVKNYSMTDKDKVSEYIKSHINALSPKKSSSKFVVSDITFDGPDRAIVSYGNAKHTYSAVAVSYIDSKSNVKITSFTILEK